ncbi:unnamed protein product [Arctia plantaginis]|uniref:Reverse transcriptase/retrotransposon-derived protein RNase H-like domain-containing protein n=1 Tax=Arctia plantaginis TaxID=874455 RepID=A0A8S1BNK0_ARCPL|nr:unnamed protein product [Arctia plantaginis]
MDENIGGKSLVTLIAAGLPEFIRNRIDPEKCETSTRLLHEISKCESLVNNKNFKIRKEEKEDNKKYSLGKKPCKTCQNLNKDKLDFEDFIIGLDMIKKIKLAQNEDLKILQKTKREINTMNAFEEIEEIKVNFNEHVNKNDFITNLHHLDNIKKFRIHNLIENYNTIFAKDKYDVGTVTDYEARIDLMVDKYCSKRPYRCTLEDKIEIEKTATSVKYLGHIIGNNTVKPLKDNMISIRNFPTPKTRKNIRQFLGKINFYHEYIPNSSILLDPLHKLLRKDAQFIWSEECEETFSNIKNILCSQPVLEIFDKDLPITIYTDASLNGIGAILKQIQKNGEEKPVGYFSKKLNDSQKRKKAIYLECLAIKEAIKYWQYWLIGRKFTVFSDHKPLENLNIKARTDDELGELTFYLSQYDFNIKYIPMKNNTEADSLSRNPVLEDNDNDEEILKTVNLITIDDIKADQQKNEKIKEKKIKIIERNGILYKKDRNREKVILSEEASVKLIKETHTEWCHLGINQMINKNQSLLYSKEFNEKH